MKCVRTLKENGNKKDIYSQNQKEKLKFLGHIIKEVWRMWYSQGLSRARGTGEGDGPLTWQACINNGWWNGVGDLAKG